MKNIESVHVDHGRVDAKLGPEDSVKEMDTRHIQTAQSQAKTQIEKG